MTVWQAIQINDTDINFIYISNNVSVRWYLNALFYDQSSVVIVGKTCDAL